MVPRAGDGCICVGLGGFGSLIFSYGVGRGVLLLEWKWLREGVRDLGFRWMVDSLALMFSCTVFFISACVFFFARSYIKEEAFVRRFGQILCLFVLSMNMVIFSGRFMTLLVGWDGLGLTSFLLVRHYQNGYAAGARMLTALRNRVGDVFLILLFCLIGRGHWELASIPVGGLSILLVLAAITKRAQFPFCRWLPSAIAAPTPVSALVHSSTLVTAGVYLLIRVTGEGMSEVILWVGGVTIFLGGVGACVECDLKKVIAFSTLSQLGVIFVALGLGAPLLAYFHLLTHAVFKAALFLCAGRCIYHHGHEQDLRGMGDLSRLPVTKRVLVTASLALCGAPFLGGFYSKEPILEVMRRAGVGWVILGLVWGGRMLTRAYVVRLLGVGVFGARLGRPLVRQGEDLYVVFPLVVLGRGAVLGGASLNWGLLPAIRVPVRRELRRVLPLILLGGGVFSWAKVVLSAVLDLSTI